MLRISLLGRPSIRHGELWAASYSGGQIVSALVAVFNMTLAGALALLASLGIG